ncbi:MAG: winged helix-turn-helix transcriptional regulator [Promethearchaeota archaeon]
MMWLGVMDIVDKSILWELAVNCRCSLQSVANKLELSVNAVKKRIAKLTEIGIIQGYQIYPSLSMMDAETSLALLKTKEPTFDNEILDNIGKHPLIYAGSILTNGDILLFNHYRSTAELDELGSYLRRVESVTDVEFHTLLAEKGGRCELKTMHLKLLRCLLEDVRMSISDLSRCSGLTPRRVRILLEEFSPGGAEPETYLSQKTPGDLRTKQACFYFQVVRDLNAGGYTAFIIRIHHEGGAETRGKIVENLREQYPFAFFYAYTSAFEPILFCVFVVEHMRDGNIILTAMRQIPGITSTQALYGYPTKRYPGLFDSFFEEKLKALQK